MIAPSLPVPLAHASRHGHIPTPWKALSCSGEFLLTMQAQLKRHFLCEALPTPSQNKPFLSSPYVAHISGLTLGSSHRYLYEDLPQILRVAPMIYSHNKSSMLAEWSTQR